MKKRIAKAFVIFIIAIIALGCANVFAFFTEDMLLPINNSEKFGDSSFSLDNISIDSPNQSSYLSSSNDYSNSNSSNQESNTEEHSSNSQDSNNVAAEQTENN